jgi:HSP20 family protein
MAETSVKPNGEVVERARPAGRAQVTFTPRVDILETPEELLLLLDLPGVKPEGVDLHFERGELTVHGKVGAPVERPGRCLAQEYETGDYYRAFLISQDVAADRIRAELKAGVLKVHLPKAPTAQPRKIAVQS